MKPVKYADLHVHTFFSDGTFSPEETITLANKKNISCIAISDHDCTDGVEPALIKGKELGVEVIPAVELTVIEDGKEIHVLGYFVAWREKWFSDILKRVQKERISRLDNMLDKLRKFDINIDRAYVMQISGNRGSVGRLHLAQAMLEKGAIYSIQEAFDKYIGDSKPCYVEDIGFSGKEAVRIIKEASGIPVLAHPSVLRDDSLLPKFVKFGIRGIEVFHSDQKPPERAKYEKFAKENNLLVTGGSDCHGMAKSRILMGRTKVPYSIVEALKKEVRGRA